MMKSNAKIHVDSQRIRPKKSEVFRLFADNSKVKKMTGYSPRINLRTGLMKTIDWMLLPSNIAKYKSELYNV